MEMREEMGPENIFIFGMTVDEVSALGKKGYALLLSCNVHSSKYCVKDVSTTVGLLCCSYRPREYYEKDPDLKRAVDQIHDGYFLPSQPDCFHHLTDHLLNHDRCVVYRTDRQTDRQIPHHYVLEQTLAVTFRCAV